MGYDLTAPEYVNKARDLGWTNIGVRLTKSRNKNETWGFFTAVWIGNPPGVCPQTKFGEPPPKIEPVEIPRDI